MNQVRFYMIKSMLPINKGETDIQLYDNVTFVYNKINVSNLSMKLSTHRIIFTHPQTPTHCFVLNMAEIVAIEGKEQGFLKKELFTQITTNKNEKVRLYAKSIESIILHLRGTFGKGLWKQVMQPPQQQQTGLFGGMHDTHKKFHSDLKLKQGQMQQSFSSFDTLYMSIQELKQVTTYVRENLKMYDQSMREKTEIENILNDIGFVSSITKEEAAKRIFDICFTTLFNKFGGMVPLLDLFYFYNKKRQTCLIAPEQLLKACMQMQKMGLGARLVTYKGNIKMLQSTTFDANTDFQKNFSQYLSYDQGVSADDISKRKGLPLIVVQIKLQNALKRGRVVKDDRIQGLKYYNNLILAMK